MGIVKILNNLHEEVRKRAQLWRGLLIIKPNFGWKLAGWQNKTQHSIMKKLLKVKREIKMYGIDNVLPMVKKLIQGTYNAMWEGIKCVKPGAKVGDINHAMQSFAEKQGYSDASSQLLLSRLFNIRNDKF